MSRWYRARSGAIGCLGDQHMSGSRSGTQRPGAGAGAVAVQIFGRTDDQGTRAALRFFKERRMTPHVVDLARKPIAAGELKRFVDRLGARALADTESRAWKDAGLGYLTMTDDALVERLLATQRLLRLPLVRAGNRVAAGKDEAGWRAMAVLALDAG